MAILSFGHILVGPARALLNYLTNDTGIEQDHSMPQTLRQHDIVGQRLKRIFTAYQLRDGWLDFVDIWFELESGILFMLPTSANSPFEAAQLGPAAECIDDRQVNALLGARILRVVRPANENRVYPGGVCLLVEGGKWIQVIDGGPTGTGFAGIYVWNEMPLADDIIEFWSQPDKSPAT